MTEKSGPSSEKEVSSPPRLKGDTALAIFKERQKMDAGKENQQKPKSRLLAVKNRFRNKQKKEAESKLHKSQSATGITEQNGEFIGKPSKLPRSKTVELELGDNRENGEVKMKQRSRFFKSKSVDMKVTDLKKKIDKRDIKIMDTNGRVNNVSPRNEIPRQEIMVRNSGSRSPDSTSNKVIGLHRQRLTQSMRVGTPQNVPGNKPSEKKSPDGTYRGRPKIPRPSDTGAPKDAPEKGLSSKIRPYRATGYRTVDSQAKADLGGVTYRRQRSVDPAVGQTENRLDTRTNRRHSRSLDDLLTQVDLESLGEIQDSNPLPAHFNAVAFGEQHRRNASNSGKHDYVSYGKIHMRNQNHYLSKPSDTYSHLGNAEAALSDTESVSTLRDTNSLRNEAHTNSNRSHNAPGISNITNNEIQTVSTLRTESTGNYINSPKYSSINVDLPQQVKRSQTFGGTKEDLERIPEDTLLPTYQTRGPGFRCSSEEPFYDKVTTTEGEEKTKGGLRVTNPDDLLLSPRGAAYTPNRNRQGPPRRHTVTVGNMDLEMSTRKNSKNTDQEQDVFLEYLANKFPQHANVIRYRPQSTPGRQAGGRRSPVAGSGDNLTSALYDSDDVMSAHSDAEGSPGGDFRRGGRLRTSLPVVRSPNKSLEKPLGLVFLVYQNETKRALLPNEVTSVDTVRALFVRSFPHKLTMLWFDDPTRKIYAMDPATSVYYELEDLRDVKDKCVLTIYDTGGPPPRGTSRSPKVRERRAMSHTAAHPGYESDSSVRSAPPATQVRSPGYHYPNVPQRPLSQEQIQISGKGQSLPVQPGYVYEQQMQKYSSENYHPGAPTHAPPSCCWSPTLRTHAQRVADSQRQPSPQRQTAGLPAGPPAQRHSLGYLPEHGRYPPANGGLTQSHSYHDYPERGSSRSGSITPVDNVETRERMIKMETQLANLTAWVHSAVVPPADSRPSSARSNSSSVVSDGSYSAKSNDDDTGTVISAPVTQKEAPVTQNEAAIVQESDSITPVQSPTSSSQQGMSDVSSATPQPVISIDMQNSIRAVNHQAKELRYELCRLRRMQLANMQTTRDSIQDTFQKIKTLVNSVPMAQDMPVRAHRQHVNAEMQLYQEASRAIQQSLSDLEASVEELRNDVLNKKCRVNMPEVESLALGLSTISRSLADLKARFPLLHNRLKAVMAGEMEIVVQDERFVKEEPERIDSSLKTCKKLTGTLYTLKRLASVQEQRPPSIPNFQPVEPRDIERKMLLENIQAVIPNHQARVESLEAADVSRERKKKIAANSQTLRFEKTLEMAQKQLRETNHVVENEARQERVLTTLYNQGSSVPETKSDVTDGRANFPLTDTTKKIVGQRSGPVPSTGNQPNVPVISSANQPITARAQDRVTVSTDGQLGIPPGPAPQKPPRSLKAEPDELVIEMVPLKASSPCRTVVPVVGQNLQKASSITLTDSQRMSTFAPTAKLPPSPVKSHPCLKESPPPIPPPPLASTPRTVTFSTRVTEIRDSPSGEKGKKIPPPPPPRKSSRSTVTMAEQNQNSQSPTYENIEKYSLKLSSSKPAKVTDSNAPTQASSQSKIPKSPTKQRPLNKFQRDIAAGIYSNMNRPDLQEQRLRPVDVVRTQTSDTLCPLASSESDSSTGTDSQQSTIRRNVNGVTKVTEDSSAQSQGGNGVSKSTEDTSAKGVKKVPPPPPVRKTSALTTTAASNDHPTSPSLLNHASSLGTSPLENPVTNGDSAQQIGGVDNQPNPFVIKTIKKYEETEIY